MLTPKSFSLLRLLNAEAPGAGPTLAAQLEIPKGRLPALIQELEAAGIGITRVPGRGYQLAKPYHRFDLAVWRDACVALGASLPIDIKKKPRQQTVLHPSVIHTVEDVQTPQSLTLEWAEQIDSTSSELMRRIPRHDIHGLALTTEWQSEGRGRRGRPWLGLPGGSLMFSLGWRFEQGAGFLAGMSLAMSVAVARALEKEGFTGIELKWPNDLVHRYHKLGGILVELNGDALGPSQAVIGVALNLVLPKTARGDIPQAVSDLASIKKDLPSREALLARVLLEMASALADYAQRGFVAFAPEWQRRHTYQNKPVKLLLPDGQTVRGTVAGVDASGALVLAEGSEVSKDSRRGRYTAGEISLRRA
ncbi:MAG: biotin--[acetyl-CoA-carboxylase] ligase [Burkholderiales bacterium]|nr:biotin--[acetyl-CoA-carboxylase] ligase [Burkholderiales bacterium]